MSDKIMLSLEDLQVLAATAERNDTRRNFPEVALQWCAGAQAEIERLGAALASQPKPAPVLLTEPELERLCVEDEFLLYCSQYEFNEIAKTVQHAVLRKNGWGV